MKKHNLAFIDTETTGLDFDTNEIIEIGGVIVIQGDGSFEIIDEFSFKIKPEHIETANPTALKINKYDPDAWKDALALSDAMKIFSEKTDNAVMIGHNISFDASFIEKAFRTTGIANKMYHYLTLDTVSIAYAKLNKIDDIKRLTLHELCDYFKIENKEEHSALSDARATFELYKKLMKL